MAFKGGDYEDINAVRVPRTEGNTAAATKAAFKQKTTQGVGALLGQRGKSALSFTQDFC
jgi:hypothetical protein